MRHPQVVVLNAIRYKSLSLMYAPIAMMNIINFVIVRQHRWASLVNLHTSGKLFCRDLRCWCGLWRGGVLRGCCVSHLLGVCVCFLVRVC